MTLATSCEATGLNPMSFSDQHGSIVLERLKYQRETGRFCDVAILVKDRQFTAHRNILASCSPYFDSILKSTKVTKEQVIVNSQSPVAFELLLNYMYSGCVVIDRSTVSELLRLANNFLVTKLKNYCAEYLDRYLDAANCLSVKVLASRFNLPSLLKAASDYFDVNINRCLLESVDILEYPIQEVVKIIKDPKYQDVISPDVHLKLIVRWVGENIETREACFRTLLDACPVSQVSDSALEFLLDYAPLFTKSQSSRFLLLHAMQEQGLSLEKYQPQLSSLSQQVGGEQLIAHQPNYLEDEENYSGGEAMDEDEYDESPVEGQPSTSQILESTYEENGVEKPRLRLKINLGSAAGVEKRRKHSDRNKLYKKALGNSAKKRGRPPKERVENDILPMMDDDEIDGVYATSSIGGGAVTYTDEDFLDPEDVEEGEDNSIENGPYKCGFCKFATLLDEDLEKHRARVHNRNTLYMCQLCDFDSNWSKPFYEHCRQQHWTQAPYRCDQCDFVANDRIQDLLAHRLTHTEDRFFKCLECGFRARTRTQLWAHEKMHSSLDERPMHCEECGRGFNQETALQLHQSTHNEPRQYVCEDCGFATNNFDHLGIHRRQHTGDMFYCHIDGCDYVSPKKSQLAAHLRTHMAVRAHMCKMCGRGFIEKSHLVRHERIHLEDKPFKCDMCDYASSRRDKLKEHILKHHNGNSAGSKSHRRRYRRAKQLAVLTAQAKLAPPEAMFRPIPPSETVSQWADNQASYQVEQPYSDLSMPPPSSSVPPGGNAFSPQRAFSVTHPAARQLASLSPGSMSLINVPLGGPDHLLNDKQQPTLADTITTPQLITPEPRSPTHSHQPDLFMSSAGMSLDGNSHRPMSLPPYSQQQQAGTREALMDEKGDFLPHVRLSKDLLDKRRYDSRVRPVVNHSEITQVSLSMSLYQILAINEKQQSVDLNLWVIQKWTDQLLGWNPYLYGMINHTIIPFDAIWLPDTYIYNSVVMNKEENERYINAVVSTNYWKGKPGAEIKFMYPALYRTSCQLDIRYFPYDQQSCKLIISSWTSSKSDIDYISEHVSVNLDNFLPNEEWVVVSFNMERVEEKFVCCPEPWVLLEASLVVRRKPLYYIVNLVIPTSVITLVAVTGFFTAASTSSERREKLSLGIDSLLAMSILMMMVSEQMPTTSEYVPLFGIFYLAIILVIFSGTILTAIILNIHLQKIYSKPISPLVSYIFFGKIARWLRMTAPTTLVDLWEETGVHFARGTVGNRKKYAKKSSQKPVRKGGVTTGLTLSLVPPPAIEKNDAMHCSTTDSARREDERRARIRENWKRIARKVMGKEEKNANGNGMKLQAIPSNSLLNPAGSVLGKQEPNPLMHCISVLSANETTLLESKLRRRYSLEWEFLATVLDRVLLILYSILVFVVTLIMILVGEAMHLTYEMENKSGEL